MARPLDVRPVGAELVALAASAVVAALLCCWFPPAHGWRWVLLGAAAAAGGVGLWRARRGWWVACGVLAGGAAVAFSVPDPGLEKAQRSTVRFEATVRDGWTPVAFGWRTRIRLHEVTAGEQPVRHPRELTLTVGVSGHVASLPPAGSRITGLGELRRLDGPPIRRPVLNVKSPLLLTQLHGPAGLDAARDAGVAALLRAAGVHPERIRAAGLAAALTLGRREGLSEGEVGALRSAGLAHLLAVSGLHVGLVAGLVWFALRLVGVRPGLARWAVMGAVGLFALGAGMAPPVRRAATGVMVYVAARQLGRPLEALPTVWGVVAVLALFEPHILVEPGFQLSAGVTLALVRWTGPLARHLPLPEGVAAAVAVPVVAQAAAFPLIGAHFGSTAPLAVLANLAAAPLAVVLVAASVAAVAVALLWPPLAGPLLVMISWAQHLLGGVAGSTEALARSFPPLPVALALLLFVLGVAAIARWRGAAVAALSGVVAAVVWVVAGGGGPAGEAEVRLLPVREGMAMLLRSGGSTVLVDTGRHPQEAVRGLAALRVRYLDALVLTHADEDHVGGAAAILRGVRVGALVLPRAAHDEPSLAPLRRLARRRGVRESWAAAGQGVRLGTLPADVIWPPPGTTLRGNDASLVLRVAMAGATVLVTGDIERLSEGRLVASRAPLGAQVLQVPHHGSRTSSTPAFLAAVSPRIALTPTGEQPRWSYPNPEVAARIRAVPALLLAQREGGDRVWWERGDSAWVGAPQPVRVHLTPRRAP